MYRISKSNFVFHTIFDIIKFFRFQFLQVIRIKQYAYAIPRTTIYTIKNYVSYQTDNDNKCLCMKDLNLENILTAVE